jgi:hypothetical protein
MGGRLRGGDPEAGGGSMAITTVGARALADPLSRATRMTARKTLLMGRRGAVLLALSAVDIALRCADRVVIGIGLDEGSTRRFDIGRVHR